MKKYVFLIITCLLNYIIVKGIAYCWNLIPIMTTDNQATLMTYCTFALFIFEFLVFICSIKAICKYVKSDEN